MAITWVLHVGKYLCAPIGQGSIATRTDEQLALERLHAAAGTRVYVRVRTDTANARARAVTSPKLRSNAHLCIQRCSDQRPPIDSRSDDIIAATERCVRLLAPINCCDRCIPPDSSTTAKTTSRSSQVHLRTQLAVAAGERRGARPAVAADDLAHRRAAAGAGGGAFCGFNS